MTFLTNILNRASKLYVMCLTVLTFTLCSLHVSSGQTLSISVLIWLCWILTADEQALNCTVMLKTLSWFLKRNIVEFQALKGILCLTMWPPALAWSACHRHGSLRLTTAIYTFIIGRQELVQIQTREPIKNSAQNLRDILVINWRLSSQSRLLVRHFIHKHVTIKPKEGNRMNFIVYNSFFPWRIDFNFTPLQSPTFK